MANEDSFLGQRRNNRRKGNVAESAVASYLRTQGLSILERNVYISKLGEIDLIANRGNSLYFVEVKSHWYEGSYFNTQNELSPILDINKCWSIFHPLERIGSRKRSYIFKTAEAYIFKHKLEHYNCILLVACCLMSDQGKLIYCEIIELS
ncbi:MAG: YraN family protein [Fastidiosipilaceae bacterium]|nr:YraN family protein [Clostridiaceae bacterium]